MRLRSLVAIVATSAAVLAGCATSEASSPNEPLRIGATEVPHAEILEFVQRDLAKQNGIELEIEKFTDYNQPNEALQAGDLDANYFQHVPFLEEYKASHGGQFTVVTPVHVEPLAVYSQKVRSLGEIPNGGKIAVPNDPANLARALRLLEASGVIKLKPGVGETATERDVVDNPKNIQLEPLAAEQLPRTLADASAAVINGNYALQAGLKDGLVSEQPKPGDKNANVLVTTPELAKDPRVTKLAELLRSPQVTDFIKQKYGSAVVPAI